MTLVHSRPLQPQPLVDLHHLGAILLRVLAHVISDEPAVLRFPDDPAGVDAAHHQRSALDGDEHHPAGAARLGVAQHRFVVLSQVAVPVTACRAALDRDGNPLHDGAGHHLDRDRDVSDTAAATLALRATEPVHLACLAHAIAGEDAIVVEPERDRALGIARETGAVLLPRAAGCLNLHIMLAMLAHVNLRWGRVNVLPRSHLPITWTTSFRKKTRVSERHTIVTFFYTYMTYFHLTTRAGALPP